MVHCTGEGAQNCRAGRREKTTAVSTGDKAEEDDDDDDDDSDDGKMS
jgi:hypothetical protein